MSIILTRDTEYDILNSCIERVPDVQMEAIYDILVNDVDPDISIHNKNRKNLSEYIMNNLKYARDDTIHHLFTYVKDKSLIRKRDVDKIIVELEEEETEEEILYRLVFKVVNDMLSALGMKNIKRLEHFQSVTREQLCKKECSDAVEKNEEALFKYFKKQKLGYYRKTKTDSYALSVLKEIVSGLDKYELKTHFHKNRNPEKYEKRNFTSYSIVKKD